MLPQQAFIIMKSIGYLLLAQQLHNDEARTDSVLGESYGVIREGASEQPKLKH